MAARMAAVLVQLGYRPASLEALSYDEAAAAGASASASEAPAAEGGRTAIVFGEPERAPAGAVVDAGRCLLDVGTVIDLGIRLDLDRLLNKQNIRESYRELATANQGLAEVLGKTNRGEASLEILLRSIDAGIVAVNAGGTVFACNERAAALAGTSAEKLVGTRGARAFPEIPFAAALEGKLPVKDGLGEHGGRIIARAVEPIVSSGALYGALAVFDTPPEKGKRRAPRERLIGTGHRARYAFSDIVGGSPALARCRDVARRMARSGSSILISGESGTGKEMFAQAIHNASARSSFPFVAVNCGALPATLLESELFGYEEGAFTGARRGGKPGLFELAHRGTLFLDEVGETPLELQLRLLRVLEEREIMRLGSDRLIGIDIRVIAATNRDLEELVASGRLREDLYYRLSVLPLRVPPLREMREDIPALLAEFMRILGSSFELSPEAERFLREREWRGNCRELRNFVEFFASLGIPRIEASDLPVPPAALGVAAPAATLGTAPSKDPGLEARRFILERLAEAFAAGRRSGRRSLAALARDRGLFLGEQEVRSLLLDLASKGLVSINPGKAGTLITEAGRAELRRINESAI